MEFRGHFDRLMAELMERLAHTDGKEEEGGREGALLSSWKNMSLEL